MKKKEDNIFIICLINFNDSIKVCEFYGDRDVGEKMPDTSIKNPVSSILIFIALFPLVDQNSTAE